MRDDCRTTGDLSVGESKLGAAIGSETSKTERKDEHMKSCEQTLANIGKCIKKEWKIAFVTAFVLGLLIHMPVLVSDIPNHDGLDSMYFDQNMITSGRWFLTIACGFSSYYNLPWLIGILGILALSVTAVLLTELLQVKSTPLIVLISGLLVSFPALTSTFAYVFTLDGYMLAMLLAVFAVLLVGKSKYGFLWGAVCLAFSMGTYQAYLPFAILLCIYQIVIIAIEEGNIKEKNKSCLNYLYMGGIGVALYYIILQVLLKIQGKELASYQGINSMESAGDLRLQGILSSVVSMYKDFVSFTINGNIVCNNVFSTVAYLVLVAVVAYVVLSLMIQRKWWKNIFFFVIIALLVLGLPIATNVILVISPNVTYHLLMRYQWVLYPILMLAFVGRYGVQAKRGVLAEWLVVLATIVCVFNYAVTDNIGYSNLQKRYEKTYAYCLRLLDRIEQTPGYYQGIPIAIVGVVGYNPFPVTDITQDVTANMIGISGDTLLYQPDNYEAFMKHYLGATLNFLSTEEVSDIYYSEEYIAMESFPAESSVQIIDGVLCVKTENMGRD